VAQALENAKEDRQEINHTLRIFECKFEVVRSTMFGVWIIVSQEEGDKGK